MLPAAPDLGPVNERQPAGCFAAVGCPTLRTALRAVHAEWAPRWARRLDSNGRIDHVLIRLAERLDRIGDGHVSLEISGDEEPRLLAAIRRSLLAQWRSQGLAVDQERMLTLLESIELLAGAPRIESAQGPPMEADVFRLVAEVAHDLRSPLTSILFLSEALRNGQSGSLSELQRSQIGLIYSAALGLAGVSNDLMTIAQERTSDRSEEAVAFSLRDTFEDVREMVAPQAETKRIQLRFRVHCADHHHGHPSPLRRVLLNLTTNALSFTPEGGFVEVLAQPGARDAIEVSVRDTGQGIPPEEMEQLFRPFQESTGREGFFFAASGLGLSIVRRLLEDMDSELKVESNIGQGTRFSFVLTLPTPH